MKCSTDPGATHYQGCECSERAHAERLAACQKERDRYMVALVMIQFLGTKGTSRIWPDSVLKECVGVAMNALKERE